MCAGAIRGFSLWLDSFLDCSILFKLNQNYAIFRLHSGFFPDFRTGESMAHITFKKTSWVAEVRRKGHKSISKSFPTKGRALEWAREVEGQIDKASFKDVRGLSDVTLNDLIDKYELEIGAIKPFGRNKADVLRKWKASHGKKSIAEITDAVLINHVKQRAKTVKGVTIAVELVYLGQILKTAKELWRMPTDPSIIATARASLQYMGLSPKSQKRDRRPTEAELKALAEHFAKVNSKVPMADLVLFAIDTAMRSGEITGLLWEDLNEDDKTILIRDRKDPQQKVGNNQVVPLLGQSFDIIKRQKRTKDRIFPFANGTISSLFPRACTELKIDDLRFHDLRHEGISRLFEQGYSIEQVALVSGHKDWGMLKRYTHLKAKSLHRPEKPL